jgi:hypothetical protein
MATAHPATNWLEPANALRDIEIREPGFVVFQFRGHSWTWIREYGWGHSFPFALYRQHQHQGKLGNDERWFY